MICTLLAAGARSTPSLPALKPIAARRSGAAVTAYLLGRFHRYRAAALQIDDRRAQRLQLVADLFLCRQGLQERDVLAAGIGVAELAPGRLERVLQHRLHVLALGLRRYGAVFDPRP